MTSEKQQNLTVFKIQGFTDIPELQLPIFSLFLFIYCIIIGSNLTIFLVILCDSYLHTPMYIFLMNISVIDIANASNILPKLLNILLTRHKTILFLECIIQMYFFISLTSTEILLLAAMAYDRYVAICHPLHYLTMMDLRHTAAFAVISWAVAFLDPIGHAVLVSKMSYCGSHIIDHFFCDVTPLLKLSCSDTSKMDILNVFDGTFIAFPAFFLTLTSYVFIISTVLKIKSAEGQRKAFSTCTSHLTCVTIFYGTLISLYMRPTSSYSPRQDRYFALLYVVLIPLLNPVIYTLKNQDVKDALRKLMKKVMFVEKYK
ncbi:olfactory receptor 1019-like [Spea bombifrons]|uniref:olfactory receptor 1019-like n=1 Tax=Spea bombifrons TaxID=233779 RepID=UPI00234B64BF|nr:olfactory receptor 1019-like [Spea bombifrons]